MRNNKLSDDINYRFSNWSGSYLLTAEKFIGWIKDAPEAEKYFTVFMGYEALGILNHKDSGIFEFFKALPFYAIEQNIVI